MQISTYKKITCTTENEKIDINSSIKSLIYTNSVSMHVCTVNNYDTIITPLQNH